MAIDPIHQLREHLLLVEQSLDEHVSAGVRTEQLESVQRERDRRLLAELTQQVSSLSQSVDATAGRALALAEEVRRERESRAPLALAIEDLQRTQIALQGRIGLIDEVARRYQAIVTNLEQAGEKRQSDLARVDNAVKLLDLKVTRELAEIRRVADEWVTEARDQLKQVGGLAKLVTALGDDRQGFIDQLAGTRDDIGQLAAELGQLGGEVKANRADFDRFHDDTTDLSRRIDTTATAVYHISDRFDSINGRLDAIRSEIRGLVQNHDELVHRIVRDEEHHARLEQRVDLLANERRGQERDAREQVDAIARRVDLETAELRARTERQHHQAIERLRKIIIGLQEQLAELEASVDDDRAGDLLVEPTR